MDRLQSRLRNLALALTVAIASISVIQVPAHCAGPNPNLAKLNNEAMIAMKKGQDTVAIEKLLKAMIIDPTYEKGRINLAIALKQRALIKSAKPLPASRDVLVALLIDPNNDTLKRLLECKVKAQDKDPAVETSFLALGAELERKSDRLGAYAAYKQALRIKYEETTENKTFELREAMAAAGEPSIDPSVECPD